MFRILRNKKILLCGILPAVELEVDFEKYKEARGLFIADPWERMKSIFLKDDYGNWHPELVTTIRMAQYGTFIGLIFGVTAGSLAETQNFIRTNDANIYINKKEVYKALNNRTLLAAAKTGFKWAPKFALFFGSYSFVSSCCELYRNKVGMIENIVAGASVGAFYRFMFGPKGMITGAVFGGLLGTIYGGALWGISKLTKTDTLEIKYAQFAYSYYKNQRKLSKTPNNEEDKKILESGLHALHDSDPLNVLNEKIDKKEKNVSEKRDK